MKCPKCAAEMPSGSNQCPMCGTVLSGVIPAGPALKPKPKMAYIVAGVLLLVILGALALSAAFRGKSVTQGGQPVGPPGQSVTNAAPPSVNGGPSVTNAPLPTPPTGQPGLSDAKKPGVPQDVFDYLKFVGEIEKYRHKLLADTARIAALATGEQAKSMIDMIDKAMDPNDRSSDTPKQASEVSDEMKRQVANWNMLLQHFDKARAPQSCAEFSGKYRAVLSTEVNGITKVMGIMANLNWSDIDSLTKANAELQSMKADPNLQGNIDQSVEDADTSLRDLSSQLGIQKPFDVKKERGGGGSIIGGGF